MNQHPDLPSVVYLPRIKKVAPEYAGSPEGREWVESWRAGHLSTRTAGTGDREAVQSSIETIYRNGGYAIPEKIYFESGDRNFVERALLELALQHDSDSIPAEVALETIKRENEVLQADLLRNPMAVLGRSIAVACGREEAPSSRELFGEDGADMSARGIRMDPVIHAIFRSIERELTHIAEKADSALLEPHKKHIRWKSSTCLTRDQLYLFMRLAQQLQIYSFGNMATGLFRQFAFLHTRYSQTVDFAAFTPWLHVIQNVQHVFLWHNFAVVNELPDEIELNQEGLTRIWNGHEGRFVSISARWPDCFFGPSGRAE